MMKILLKILLSLSFYLLLFAVSRYFILKAKSNTTGDHEETGVYFKYDWLAAAGIYLFFIVLFFYPCLKNMYSFLIGPPEDNLQHFWDIWWARKALTEHRSIFFSDHIYYPNGASLFLHPLSFYNIFLALIFPGHWAQPLVYNLLILHSFLFAGIGAFFLIKYLTKNSYTGLIGGFIFAFNPFHIAHAQHHIEISSIQFIPLFALFFLKTMKENSKINLLLACLFFFLNGASSWYLYSYMILFIILFYIYSVLINGRLFLKKILSRSLIIWISSIPLLLPWVWSMLFSGFKLEGRWGDDNYFTDTLGYIVPDAYHWLSASPVIKNINSQFAGRDWEKVSYLGIAAVLIVIFSFKGIVEKTSKYFLGFVIFSIFSMASSMHVLGKNLPVVLPYVLVKCLPFFSHLRTPSTFIIYAYLFWAVIVAFAFKHLIHLYKNKPAGKLLLSAAALFLFIDYFSLCGAMTDVTLPACYKIIQSDASGFGLLDLPVHPKNSTASLYMAYQTSHGIPIVEGEIDRVKGTLLESLHGKNWQVQNELLVKNKVKYIVVHKKFDVSKDPFSAGILKNPFKVVYEDTENTVLKVFD